jgi:hypothetical protein
MFDETRKIGGLSFDPSGDIRQQLTDIVGMLLKKLSDSRLWHKPTVPVLPKCSSQPPKGHLLELNDKARPCPQALSPGDSTRPRAPTGIISARGISSRA